MITPHVSFMIRHDSRPWLVTACSQEKTTNVWLQFPPAAGNMLRRRGYLSKGTRSSMKLPQGAKRGCCAHPSSRRRSAQSYHGSRLCETNACVCACVCACRESGRGLGLGMGMGIGCVCKLQLSCLHSSQPGGAFVASRCTTTTEGSIH